MLSVIEQPLIVHALCPQGTEPLAEFAHRLETCIRGQDFLQPRSGRIVQQHRRANQQLAVVAYPATCYRRRFIARNRNDHLPSVGAQHMHPIDDHRPRRVEIDRVAWRALHEPGHDSDDSREPQRLEDAQVRPADIELPATAPRTSPSSGRRGGCCSSFARRPGTPHGIDVARGVRAFEVAVAASGDPCPLMTPAAISGFATICAATIMIPGTPSSRTVDEQPSARCRSSGGAA